MIQALKYQQQESLACFLGELLAETVRDRLGNQDWEGVVPVPLHPTRQRERSFNQAERLAQKLAKALQLPLQTGWLIRTRATRPQAELDREDRLRNLQYAFALKSSEPIPFSRLLLVDDVLTTGATASACARLLKTAGVGQIAVVAVAHGG